MKMALPGHEVIAEFFGGWPSFHDAEILGITLHRDSRSHIDIRERVGDESDALEGVVRFRLDKVTACDLAGTEVDVQNVLRALYVEPAANGAIRLVLDGIFGLSGFVEGHGVSVELLVAS